MANWRSYIDPSVGDGQNTINGIIASGPTYGIGISDDLSVTGLSTFSDIARFSSTVRLDGQLRDGDNAFGTSGQVLSSDGTDTKWINAAQLSAGAASQVAVNDDSNTNAERFITIVDSSSGNNNVKTDASLKYNPSTNTITTVNITGNVTGNVTGNLTGNVTGNASGNSGTATVLQTARNIGGVSFDGSASINLPGVNQAGNQNTSGNAATATKLATARNIGGVSFDGSAAINLPGVNQAGNQNTSGNAATATTLETTRDFSISGEITANAQSFNGSGNVTLSATVNDNIIDEANLKISNSPQNGFFLKCNTGVSGGLTWSEVTLPTAATLDGTTLASGITASSITSVGTLNSLSVSGTSSFGNNVDINGNLEFGTNNYKLVNGNNANNLYLITGTTGSSGLSAFNSSSQWRWQIYGEGTNYGFLDANWGGWDIKKTINGAFYVDEGSGLARVWNSLNDGSGSGLDSDTVDGKHANVFISSGAQSSVSGWHVNGYRNGNGTSPHMYFSHSSGYGMHINTYNTSNTIYAFELHNNSSVLFQVFNSGRIVSGQGYVFVAGMIVIWNGAANAIPTGWALCDGNNGTPNLVAKFVIGAAGSGSYQPGYTGGEATKTLGTSNLPSHTHTSGTLSATGGNHVHQYIDQYVVINAGYRPWPANNNDCQQRNVDTSGTGAHTHTISGNTGDQGGTMGQSFSILPPYYALCYIMKL